MQGVGIWIDNSVADSFFTPDTFDRDIILHEYAHFICDQLNFFEIGTGPHAWNGNSGPFLAAKEGFATFLASVMQSSPVNRNYYNNFTQFQLYNTENGEYGSNLATIGSANDSGDQVEAAVAGILWDVYDQVNDDYSRWSGTPGVGVPDGIADTLSYSSSLANILSTCIDRTVGGHHPQTLDEFYVAWFQAPSFGHQRAMNDIWLEHGDGGRCCVATTGNADYSPDDAVDISDLNLVIEYIQQISPVTFICESEANVDASTDKIVDIGDLTVLIGHLFISNQPLPSCLYYSPP